MGEKTFIQCLFCPATFHLVGLSDINYKDHFLEDHNIITYDTEKLILWTLQDQYPLKYKVNSDPYRTEVSTQTEFLAHSIEQSDENLTSQADDEIKKYDVQQQLPPQSSITPCKRRRISSDDPADLLDSCSDSNGSSGSCDVGLRPRDKIKQPDARHCVASYGAEYDVGYTCFSSYLAGKFGAASDSNDGMGQVSAAPASTSTHQSLTKTPLSGGKMTAISGGGPRRAYKTEKICDKCGSEFDQIFDYDSHLVSCHNKRQRSASKTVKSQDSVNQTAIDCGSNDKQISSTSPLNLDETNIKKSPKYLLRGECYFRCQICSRKIVKWRKKEHLTKEHNMSLPSYATEFPSEDAINKVYTCLFCDKTVPWMRVTIRRHLDSWHGVSLEEYEAKYHPLIRLQMKETHSEFQCRVCDTEFVEQTQLEDHISQTHPSLAVNGVTADFVLMERQSCDKCVKSFPLRWQLERHKLCVHSGDSFGVLNALKTGESRVNKSMKARDPWHKRGGYECRKCQRQFAYKRHGLNHIASVHQRFSRSPSNSGFGSDLTHLIVATRTFRCAICSRSLAWTSEAIQQHLDETHCLSDQNYAKIYLLDVLSNNGLQKETSLDQYYTGKSRVRDCLKKRQLSPVKPVTVSMKKLDRSILYQHWKDVEVERFDYSGLTKQELGRCVDSSIENAFQLVPKSLKTSSRSCQMSSSSSTVTSNSLVELPQTVVGDMTPSLPQIRRLRCPTCLFETDCREKMSAHMEHLHTKMDNGGVTCCGLVLTTRWNVFLHLNSIAKTPQTLKGAEADSEQGGFTSHNHELLIEKLNLTNSNELNDLATYIKPMSSHVKLAVKQETVQRTAEVSSNILCNETTHERLNQSEPSIVLFNNHEVDSITDYDIKQVRHSADHDLPKLDIKPRRKRHHGRVYVKHVSISPPIIDRLTPSHPKCKLRRQSGSKRKKLLTNYANVDADTTDIVCNTKQTPTTPEVEPISSVPLALSESISQRTNKTDDITAEGVFNKIEEEESLCDGLLESDDDITDDLHSHTPSRGACKVEVKMSDCPESRNLNGENVETSSVRDNRDILKLDFSSDEESDDSNQHDSEDDESGMDSDDEARLAEEYKVWANQCRIDCKHKDCTFQTHQMTEFRKHVLYVHRQLVSDYIDQFDVDCVWSVEVKAKCHLCGELVEHSQQEINKHAMGHDLASGLQYFKCHIRNQPDEENQLEGMNNITSGGGDIQEDEVVNLREDVGVSARLSMEMENLVHDEFIG